MSADDSYEAQEEALVERTKQGDRQALAQLIEQKRSALLAFIERNMSDRLRAKTEAQDILQETIVYALDSVHRYDLTEREPFSWLCQMAERKIIDNFRRFFATQKRAGENEVSLQGAGAGCDQGPLINVLVNSMTSPSAAFSRNQKESRMMSAIKDLPQESQDAIRMRYVEGLPTKEIAKLLGKSDGSIRVLLSRTLRKLETTLSDDTWCRPDGD